MRFLFTKLFSSLLLINTIWMADVQSLSFNRFDTEEEATSYFLRYYNIGCCAFQQEKWEIAAVEFEKVVKAFPKAPCTAPVYFFYGIALYELGDYDLANHALSNYLRYSTAPEFFEETILYKYRIAEAFRCGCRRRLVKFRCFPKFMSARSLALSIYDEVIMAMPTHPIAADALYAKGFLLQSTGDYRGSTEEFQAFIRRFPKHEKTPDAYIMVSRNYYLQSQTEFQNPDLLALAAINAKRFKEVFPKEERLADVDAYVVAIEELYAHGLTSVGAFYERKCKPFAAALYYRSAIVQFPNTRAADWARCRIDELGFEVALVPDCSESTHMTKEPHIQDVPLDDKENRDHEEEA